MPNEKLTQLVGVTLPLVTSDLFYVVQDVSTTPASRKITFQDLNSQISSGGNYVTKLPSAVSGLVGWWEADAIVGLNDGDPVATWPDQASSPHDFTESTNKPTYKTNIVNGLPVVRFDATNDVMSSTLSVSNPFTMMIIVINNQAVDSPTPSTRWVQGSNNWLIGLNKNSGGRENPNVYAGGFMTTRIDSMWATGSARIATLKQQSGMSLLYVDGKSSQFRSASPPDAPGTLAMGGGGSTPSQLADADIIALVVWNNIISENDRLAVEQGFRQKYNLCS